MGTTRGAVVISYDINRLHTEVKEAMQALGYYDYWYYTNHHKKHEMPNTTLWHKAKTSDQAMVDLKGVCNRLGVKLEKAVAVWADEFVGG